MKLGVFTVLFGRKPFEEMLDYVAELGVEAVEIGTGAYPGNTYCRPAELLASSTKLEAFSEAIKRRGLVISALSCHGNPVHPQRTRARADHDVFMQTLKLARRLHVGTVITFSGCPGGGPQARQPNWIVSPWPPEFSDMLEWQWRERVIPYWKDAAKAARSAGVRIAIEMHPNFIAYNPESMLRLRDVAPDTIGCNFDPSHMIWQQIDVTSAIRVLAGSIFHVHAKDCRVDRANTMRNGVLDSKNYTKESERSWIFRTVGYGSDAIFWKDLVSNLRMGGYDHVLSIEHEDSLMSGAEGLKKAIAFLKPVLIAEPAGEAYWA
ncbi:MAG: sugar phosphate isomerase/epimerase [Acidobacteria bacterium]|nr:sugar phosphate isomerase/epimerase [Acidobacteriota bacterium]